MSPFGDSALYRITPALSRSVDLSRPSIAFKAPVILWLLSLSTLFQSEWGVCSESSKEVETLGHIGTWERPHLAPVRVEWAEPGPERS